MLENNCHLLLQARNQLTSLPWKELSMQLVNQVQSVPVWLGLGLALPAWFSPILEVLLCNVERHSQFWMISWLLGNGRTWQSWICSDLFTQEK